MVKAFSFMLDHGTSEETIRRRAEMVLAVDESLGRLMAALEKNNELDNTVIMFTSDNGFFFGDKSSTIYRKIPMRCTISSTTRKHRTWSMNCRLNLPDWSYRQWVCLNRADLHISAIPWSN